MILVTKQAMSIF